MSRRPNDRRGKRTKGAGPMVDGAFRSVLGVVDDDFAKDQYALYFFARRYRSKHELCRQVCERVESERRVESGRLITPSEAEGLVRLADEMDWLIGIGPRSKAHPGQRGRQIPWARASRDGDPREAIERLNTYLGTEAWLLELQEKHRTDETWRPTPRVAGIVIERLSGAHETTDVA